MNKIPKSYKVQKSCLNCRNVFLRIEQDEITITYCRFGDLKRPLSNSSCFFENFYNYLVNIKGLSPDNENFDVEYEKLINEWEEWCKGREVNPCGICDEYLEKE